MKHDILGFLLREKLLLILAGLTIFILLSDYNGLTASLHRTDFSSLSIIISLIFISEILLESGLTYQIATKIFFLLEKHGAFGLLSSLIFISFVTSPLVMNDGSVFIVVPIGTTMARLAGVNPALVVATIVFSVNIGSTLLPTGNPQDIIIFQRYQLHIVEYTSISLQLYLAGLLTVLAYTYSLSKRFKPVIIEEIPSIRTDRTMSVIGILLLSLTIVLMHTDYSWASLLATIVVLGVKHPKILRRIDKVIIIIMTLFFIDFTYLGKFVGTHVFNGFSAYFTSIGLSQLISNVPVTIALSQTIHPNNWKPFFIGVNIGGTGTVISSLANLIATRLAMISYREYHKHSIPIFLTMCCIGIILVLIN